MSKIMSFTGHALKNLFHKPVTEKYPFAPKEYTNRTRGHVNINIDDCLFCGICSKKCPSSAITVDRATKQWQIDRMGCVQCENCVNNCPKKCLSMDNHYTTPDSKKVIDTFNGVIEEKSASSSDVVFNSENCLYCGLCAKKCPADAITIDRPNKKWEINKDECAKCGTCVTACPKKCLSMGEEKKAEEKSSSGNVVNDISVCILCGLCAKKCPANAIEVDRTAKTWKINRDECLECGACVLGCPKKCLSMDGKEKQSGTETLTK